MNHIDAFAAGYEPCRNPDDRADADPANAGCVLLDTTAAIRQLDAVARATLSEPGSALAVKSGRLGPRQANHAWDAALLRAANGTPAAWLAPGPGGSLQVALIPLGRGPAGRSADAGAPTLIQVRLVKPACWRIDAVLLADLWSITAAEARVAAGLAEGMSTDELACGLGVKVNTVRSHLKSVMHKTGLGRQAALVAGVWRSAAAVRPRPVFTTPGSRGAAADLAQMGNDPYHGGRNTGVASHQVTNTGFTPT